MPLNYRLFISRMPHQFYLFLYAQFFQCVEPASSALTTPGPISVATPDPGSSRSFCPWYTPEFCPLDVGELSVGEEGLSSYWPSSDIGGIGRSEPVDGSVFLRGRQHRKKNKIPATATAARTPTIIPAMAPPESEELVLFSSLGVLVGELVFVVAEVEAAVADV